MKNKIDYLLHLADSALIISHRNSEWCGHGPVLEQDIAITNISLDLLGQARLLYQYAAELINTSNPTNHTVTEDSLAYLRNEREFKNLLITELPKADWAVTVLRQYLFSQYQILLFTELQNNNDKRMAEIAIKSLKEIAYHLRWSKEWVIRLGDGTELSKAKMLAATDDVWSYTGEMFMPEEYEQDLNINFSLLQQNWLQQVAQVFEEATLPLPQNVFMQTGGKKGVHTEHLGYILAEMQYLQRTYVGAEW
jgi:ring-1,2-phenylacetyl-CoA epoxidase subunit PaaC